MEIAKQNVIKAQSELEYAKYQKQLYEVLASQGAGPEEDFQKWSAQIMFVPIYQGGALRAQVRIATAQQEQAVAHYGSVSLAAFEEVETALNEENLLSQRLPFEENAVRDRTEAFRLGEIKYRYGTTDLFSVLQLQQEQITQQIDLIKLNYALLGNRINLHLALGGSFDASPAASP
jgi:outer membrane protein, multidrug efflux system